MIINDIGDLTFLPISFFKTHEVYGGSQNPEKIFKSSGTTQQVRSQHMVKSLADYHQSCESCFAEFYGSIEDYRHIFFLPFYEKNPDSSLLSMTNYFLAKTKSNGSQYIKDLMQLPVVLDSFQQETILWTVTYGVMDMIEADIQLVHSNLKVIETGGSKGLREVPPRDVLHQTFEAMNPGVHIGSEFGMCELSSQAYFQDGVFRCPQSLFVCTTDLNDPFQITPFGQRGRLCFVDLNNLNTCSFIETEDLGIAHSEKSFEVLGRLYNSDLRGCNLMY